MKTKNDYAAKQIEGLARAQAILSDSLSNARNCAKLNLKLSEFNFMSRRTPAQAVQTLKNLELMKEAINKFFQKNNTEELPTNISTIPLFLATEKQQSELSEETKQMFARIGLRTRKAFIKEQTARADKYNITYDIESVNFLELEQEIDAYEELIEKAKKYCFSWDYSIYDPVGLQQEIEDCEQQALKENNQTYTDYFASIAINY